MQQNNNQAPLGYVQSVVGRAKEALQPVVIAEAQQQFTQGPMAPGQPMVPVFVDSDGDQIEARRWDYSVGFNLQTTPRSEFTNTRPNQMTSDQLRWISREYGLLRNVIETRKNQVIGQKWTIKSRNESNAQNTARYIAAQKLISKPDGRTRNQDWLKALLEDLFVLDQVCIRVDCNVAGTPIAFRPIDSGTIKLIIDQNGEKPAAPLPAYAQIIKGVTGSWYDTNEMIFRVYNPSTDWPYGYSPVEQIADVVSLGLRRQQHQLNYYTEGNLPESIIKGPSDWDQNQIKKFQKYWDGLYEGPNALKLKRRTRFMPHGSELIQAKEAILKDEMDDWLARQICYAFNVSPSALVKDNNRAVGETINEQNKAEGLVPLLNWLKDIYDDILDRAGFGEFEFDWVEEDSMDPLEQAQVNQIYGGMGVKTINEMRREIGLEPVIGGDELQGPQAQSPSMGGYSQQDFFGLFGVNKRHGYGINDATHRHHHSNNPILKAHKHEGH